MAIDDFESWKMLARPAIAVYTPQTGGGPNYYPGRYVGQTVTGPDGIVYDFGGMDQFIFDLQWTAVSPAGTIVIVGDWFVQDTLTPPAYIAQSLKPSGFAPFIAPPVFVRSTVRDWFVGVTGGSTGDDFSFSGSGIRTAVDEDGLGAYYTVFDPEFDAFLGWSGIQLDFQTIVVWTGQYFVALAPTDDINHPYHSVRVYRSPDDGLSYDFLTEIEPPALLVENWLRFTCKSNATYDAWAQRGGVAGGTDDIMFYDEAPVRAEIVFPPDEDIELIAVTRVVDNVRTYTEGADYTVNVAARMISWAPGGFEPTAGKVYRIEYTFESYANWPLAAVSPINGVIYALLIGGDPPTGTVPLIQVVVSHDHGASWAALGSIPATYSEYGNQGPMLAWLDGVLVATLQDGIWRSSDGGFTWAHVVLPSPSGSAIVSPQAFQPPKILALSATDALVTLNDVQIPIGTEAPNGAYFAGRILKTTDQGATWTQVFLQSEPTIGQLTPNSNSSPDVLVRLNATEIIAMSQFGTFYYSGDTGDSWEAVQPYTTGLVDNFPFQNSNQGIQVDGRHALIATAPNGGIFTNIPADTLCGETANRKVRRGRTVAVAEIEYLYSWEANAQDFGAGGARELIFEVQARTFVGGKTQLGDISRSHVRNPAPDMSGVEPAVIPLPGALFIDWSSFLTTDLDMDHFEVRYGFSANELALTSTIRRSKDQNNVFIPNLVASLTVYFKIVPFDAFGSGPGTAIFTGVPLVTISLSA